MDELIQQIADLVSEEQDRAPAPVIRWTLACEVMPTDAEEIEVLTRYSDNMAAWQIKGMAWLMERDATHALESS